MRHRSMAANLYTEEQFDALGMQARARFAIVRPNGCHCRRGSLPLASWCAIYCVAAPDPSPERADSAALRLYEPPHRGHVPGCRQLATAATVPLTGTICGAPFPARWRFFPPGSCTKSP